MGIHNQYLQATEENAALIQELDAKEKQLDDLKEEKDAMQITMDGLIEQKKNLEQELEQIKSSKDANKDETMQEMMENIDALKAECKILKENGDKMEAAYEQQIEGLVKKLEEREEEIKAINNGSDGMQKMIKNVSEQNENLLKKLELKDSELESVYIENDKTQKQK